MDSTAIDEGPMWLLLRGLVSTSKITIIRSDLCSESTGVLPSDADIVM